MTKKTIKERVLDWWQDSAKKYYTDLELRALKLQIEQVIVHTEQLTREECKKEQEVRLTGSEVREMKSETKDFLMAMFYVLMWLFGALFGYWLALRGV